MTFFLLLNFISYILHFWYVWFILRGTLSSFSLLCLQISEKEDEKVCSNISRYIIKHTLVGPQFSNKRSINSCVIYGFSQSESQKIKGFVFRHDFFRWLTEIRKYQTPGVRPATEKRATEEILSFLRSAQKNTLRFHKLCLAATAKTAKPTCRPWMESRRK